MGEASPDMTLTVSLQELLRFTHDKIQDLELSMAAYQILIACGPAGATKDPLDSFRIMEAALSSISYVLINEPLHIGCAPIRRGERECILKWIIHPKIARTVRKFIECDTPEAMAFARSLIRLSTESICRDRKNEMNLKSGLGDIVLWSIQRLLRSSRPTVRDLSAMLVDVAGIRRHDICKLLLQNGAEVVEDWEIGMTLKEAAIYGRDWATIETLLLSNPNPGPVKEAFKEILWGDCELLGPHEMEENAISLRMVPRWIGLDAQWKTEGYSWGALELTAFRSPRLYQLLLPFHAGPTPEVCRIAHAAYGGPTSLADLINSKNGPEIEIWELSVIFAVLFKATDVLEAILQTGVDPNCPYLMPLAAFRPFSLALQGLDPKPVELLLTSGCDISNGTWSSVLSDTGFTGAEYRLRFCDVWTKLFSSGLRLDLIETHGIDLLLLAAERGDVSLVRHLVEMGVSMKARASPSRQLGGPLTVLSAAIMGGNPTPVRMLWDLGAEFEVTEGPDRGFRELFVACRNFRPGMVEVIARLVDDGAAVEPWPQGENAGLSPLRALLRQTWMNKELSDEAFEVIQLLISRGANCNRFTFMEWPPEPRETPMTAFQEACFGTSFEIVKSLVKNGADVNSPAIGKDGRTPLQAACDVRRPKMEIIRYLMDLGADVNAPGAEPTGVTALEVASSWGHVEVALILLEAGARVNVENRVTTLGRKSALNWAACNGRFDLAKVLVNAGAESDVPVEHRFECAISIAEARRFPHIADMLVEERRKAVMKSADVPEDSRL
jgi:ankyrin repeat protein